MIINKAYISDSGDSSVGIDAENWELEFKGGLEIDADEKEDFRRELLGLFETWNQNGFHGQVLFDDEREEPNDDLDPEPLELDDWLENHFVK